MRSRSELEPEVVSRNMPKSTNFISLISDLYVVSFDSKRTQSLYGFPDGHDGCSSHIVLRPF